MGLFVLRRAFVGLASDGGESVRQFLGLRGWVRWFCSRNSLGSVKKLIRVRLSGTGKLYSYLLIHRVNFASHSQLTIL